MNSQKVIEVQETDTLDQAAEKSGLAPRALILLLGDYDAALHAPVRSICSRVIAPLAVTPGALVIDDGRPSGCAAAMGEAARDQDVAPPLVGIAVPGEVDANHPLIVRLPAEWTGGADALKIRVQIAAKLARDDSGREKPVLAILAGGSDAQMVAVLRCARYGWPILLIQGTGGLADRIAAAMEAPADGSPAPPIADPELREIVDSGPESFALGGDMDDLERILLARIELRADTLADAWARLDDLDEGAKAKHTIFQRMQGAILVLAVVATLVAILSQSATAVPPVLQALMPESMRGTAKEILHLLVILAPISISVLVACNSRFREGNKWVLLRAAAEAIRREIFRYRAQAGAYSDARCSQISRESKLAAKIKDITSALAQSEVNKTCLPHQKVTDLKRLKFLNPEEYVHDRVEAQISRLLQTTAKLYAQLKRTQIWIYLAGGLGTFLAAVHGDVWVALTTAVAGAWTTKLETEQVENSLVQYNQSLISLRNIESWWKALSQWEKGRRKNIDLLVDQTEKTLEGELAGWVQQMQSELDKLTEKESEQEPKRQAAEAP